MAASGKQVKITLTWFDAVRFERWADTRREKVATLAHYIVRKAIDEAEAKGEIPPPETGNEQTAPTTSDAAKKSTANALRRLSQTGKLTRSQAALLEQEFGLEAGELDNLTKQGNGHNHDAEQPANT